MTVQKLKLPDLLDNFLASVWDEWGASEAQSDEAKIYEWLESREFKAYCVGVRHGAGMELTPERMKDWFQSYKLSREYHESE